MLYIQPIILNINPIKLNIIKSYFINLKFIKHKLISYYYQKKICNKYFNVFFLDLSIIFIISFNNLNDIIKILKVLLKFSKYLNILLLKFNNICYSIVELKKLLKYEKFFLSFFFETFIKLKQPIFLLNNYNNV